MATESRIAGGVGRGLAWWQSRRVSLEGMSRLDLLTFWGAVGVASAAVVVLFLSSRGIEIPGGSDLPASLPTFVAGSTCEVPPPAVPVPRLATLLPLLALLLAGPALIRGVRTGALRSLTTVTLALVGAVFSASLLHEAELQEVLRGLPALFPFVTWPASLAGYVGIVASAIVALSAIPRVGRALQRFTPALAATPFALILLIYVFDAVVNRPARLVSETPCLVGQDLATYVGGLADPHASMLFSLQRVLLPLRFDFTILPVLALWFAMTGTRTTRDAARWWSGRLRGGGIGPIALLVAAAAWVGLGLSGLLPTILGGRAPEWTRSRTDGFVSWALAAGIVLALCIWLVRGRFSARGHGFQASTWALVVAFSVTSILSLFILMAATTEQMLRPGAENLLFTPALEWLSGPFGDLRSWSWLAVLLLAVPIGLGLLRSPLRSAGLFLVAVGVWGTPRAIAVGLALARGETSTTTSPGTVEGITLMATLVIGFGLLVLGARAGRIRAPIDLDAIALIVVAFGLVTLVSLLIPDALVEETFAPMLGFPLAATLLWDAEGINRSPHRTVVAPAVAAFGAVLLCLAATTAATSGLTADGLGEGELAKMLFTVPFLTVLLVVEISERRSGDVGIAT